MRTILHLVALGFFTSAVHASDGVFEINHDCAMVGGCFDGDSSGYPVTISNAGSYRLTGSLTTENVNQTLIEVTANNVTIDMNGFSLLGPVGCSGSPTTCSASGSGDGISTTDPNLSVSVFNGIVRGMGNDGIAVGSDSIIENIKAFENAGDGIQMDGLGGTLLKNIVAKRNGDDGIFSVNGSVGHLTTDSVVRLNGDRGISGGFCSNIVSISNGRASACSGLAPNQCETSISCD